LDISGENVKEIMNATPVLLITYNRPFHTEKVLQSLKEHNVQNLYIFSDGPKCGNDLSGLYETRLLFQKIDWTNPTIIEQEKNFGLANSIFNAVNLVFQKFDKIILIEDDCVPQKYFFDFVNVCLNKYSNHNEVFGISGYTVSVPETILSSYPYDLYFFPRIGSWGWATWKNRWKHFEPDLSNAYQKAIIKNIDIEQGGTDVPNMLKQLIQCNLKDVWTLNWLMSMYLHRGYYIYPTQSHIDNIGMDGTGVHCGRTNKFESRIAESKPTRFPDNIFINDLIYKNFRKYYDVPQGNHVSKKTSNELAKSAKVVHISTHDFGGAGKAAYRLHKGLQKIGVDSTMLVTNKKSNDPSVRVFPTRFASGRIECANPSEFNSPLYAQQKLRWENLLSKYTQKSRYLELFSDEVSDIKLDCVKEIHEADIINFHWVAGSVDVSSLPQTLKNKSIVWTLHDMNAFTGGCHYSDNCKKYETACSACPQLGSNRNEDLSQHIWQQKLMAYSKLYFNIVTPSRWLAKCASRSKLFSNFPIRTIPYGFPLDRFKPYPKNEIRQSLNIPQTAKVILFGAASVNNLRKGFNYLLEALSKFTPSECSDIIILTFGAFPDNIQPLPNLPIHSLGPIDDEFQIALAYSAADVFVLPSLQDNLPNTVIEAMACGVPVVGFDVGGIPDMVEHKKTGFLAKPKDVDSLTEGIKWVFSSSERHSQLSANCRVKVESQYALEIQAQAYKNLYESVLEKSQTKVPNIEELNNKGEEFFRQGKLDEAKRTFMEALTLDSKNAAIHNNLAVVYHQQKDKEKADIHYQKATQLAPDNMDFQKNLADFYYAELGRVEDAVNIYAAILKNNPKDVETLLILGHISLARENSEDAILFYRRVLEIEPDNKIARQQIEKLGDNDFRPALSAQI
jgi:glycosyltransferase involved in cell wall biosynthesis